MVACGYGILVKECLFVFFVIRTTIRTVWPVGVTLIEGISF